MIVDAPDLLVLAKFFPSRFRIFIWLGIENGLCARISEKEHITTVEPGDFGQPRYDLVGGMALGGFEMSDVRSRSLDAPSDLFLGRVGAGDTPFAKHLTEAAFLHAAWHLNVVP